MATRKFKFKHIAASASTHVGDAGELVLDTATNTLKVLDGSTPGGSRLEIRPLTVTDTDGGAIDLTKDIHFVRRGQTYTLADGSYVGQKLTFIGLTGGSGKVTITVANVVYNNSAVPTSATNYAWDHHTGSEDVNTRNIRECIWSGSAWHLDYGT